MTLHARHRIFAVRCVLCLQARKPLFSAKLKLQTHSTTVTTIAHHPAAATSFTFDWPWIALRNTRLQYCTPDYKTKKYVQRSSTQKRAYTPNCESESGSRYRCEHAEHLFWSFSLKRTNPQGCCYYLVLISIQYLVLLPCSSKAKKNISVITNSSTRYYCTQQYTTNQFMQITPRVAPLRPFAAYSPLLLKNLVTTPFFSVV